MIAGTQQKILLDLTKEGELVMNKNFQTLFTPQEVELPWKLIRERDGLIKKSKDIHWLEFHEDRTFKNKFNDIAIGRSLIMSPFNRFFTWMTTSVTKIIEEKENYFKFETENSIYELFKLK